MPIKTCILLCLAFLCFSCKGIHDPNSDELLERQRKMLASKTSTSSHSAHSTDGPPPRTAAPAEHPSEPAPPAHQHPPAASPPAESPPTEPPKEPPHHPPSQESPPVQNPKTETEKKVTDTLPVEKVFQSVETLSRSRNWNADDIQELKAWKSEEEVWVKVRPSTEPAYFVCLPHRDHLHCDDASPPKDEPELEEISE